jgi:hypothetical protein
MRLLLSNPNQFKLKQDLLWVIILTFITIIIWISYSIYLAYNKSTIDPEVTALLEPLNPALNQKALDILASQIEIPSEFTILVQQGSGESVIIVPIDQLQNPSQTIPENSDIEIELQSFESEPFEGANEFSGTEFDPITSTSSALADEFQ